ncbi:thermonuclease family protein [Clostridiaceae bacterium HSG29]|nr:thermonuclease family protein [Clostridiaceae bacterium HSG29]
MKKIIVPLIVILYFIIIIFNPFQSNDYTISTVEKVFDGDTIYVNIENENYVIRLTGINTPEVKGKYIKENEYFGPEASKFLKDLLPTGTIVYLESDIDDKDKYDRLLRYVYLKPDGKMVNEILLEKGYAEVMNIEPNIKYSNRFKELEEKAKEKNIGKWKRYSN